jgi:hypothetical protein
VEFRSRDVIGSTGEQGPKVRCVVTPVSRTIAVISEHIAFVRNLTQCLCVNVEIDALGVARVCQSVPSICGQVTCVGRLVTFLCSPFKLPFTRIRRVVVVAAPVVHSGPPVPERLTL